MLKDLLNFDDPLNIEASEQYELDKVRAKTTFLDIYSTLVFSLSIIVLSPAYGPVQILSSEKFDSGFTIWDRLI